ncbi:hypothetical protein SNE40_018066 [Patella caerulea]|uniref:Uncharacterized protein n=1 Tax=Patella caerulea TaxID=87958 RepID=A0AAN8J9Q7_PATCE
MPGNSYELSNNASPSDNSSGKIRTRNGNTNSSAVEMNGVNKVEPAVEIKDGTSDKKEKKAPDMVGALEMFRFADCTDKLLMIFGSIAAVIHGAAFPVMIIVFGDMIDLFVNSALFANFLADPAVAGFLSSINITAVDVIKDPSLLMTNCLQLANFTGGNITCATYSDQLSNQLLDKMGLYAIYFIIIAVCVFVLGYAQVCFWMTSAERQAHRIRLSFFRNVMRQEIGWFDTHDSGELNSRLADDINKIQDGLGDKMSSSVQWLSAFLAGFIVGFIYGWKLTLVILAISPALVIAAGIMSKLAASLTSKELKAYAKAGSIAEEVLSSIRTVVAFGGQKTEVERYSDNLIDAKKFGIKKGMTNGVAMGFVWFAIFCAYALGFWYGGKLTIEEPENYTVGKMLIVFFSVLIGAFSLGNASPGIQAFSTGRGAAFVIFKLIDQVPLIDSYSTEGRKPSSITGDVMFTNIHFTYPSRKDVKVLNGINITLKRGQTIALVGSSGCGKSTTVQLLQRFYDPQDGSITIDGNDLKDLNVEWLRKHIGIVSQEPTLFATTIAENIRYGRDDVTDAEIEQATRKANAHDFISQLPEKYETLVGERGAQLSGGQKQRIAIARALVRDPKILLLDEATSALDTESESIVQEALDKAREGRTTLVIAHRLSTIKNADHIYSLKDGQVVEEGSHDELMGKEGIYYQLVMNQTNKNTDDLEVEEEIDEFIRVGSKREVKPQLERMVSATGSLVKGATSAAEKVEKVEDEELPSVGFGRMIRTNGPEWFYILIGCFASILNGGVQPAFAIIFAEVLGVFQLQGDERSKQIQLYALLLLGLGVISMVMMFLQSYMFAISGENLTIRLRKMAFMSMLRQEISWFDDQKNNTGVLTTKLSTEASLVQGATGIRLGMVFQNVAAMLTAIIIAFIYGWKLTLVILAFVPFIMLAGAIQMKVLAGVAGKNKEALEGAGKVAVEAIESIRTVVSLSLELVFHKLYVNQLLKPYKDALKRAHLVGLAYGFSDAIIFFAYAAAFYFGAYLIQEGEMNYVEVFRVFGAIVFGAMALGQASSFAPDASKAQLAASHIFFLIDKKPKINSESEGGQKPSKITSQVEFNEVRFRYPTRPDVEVLKGLNIVVNPGETLALVGSSGCGKSTTVQLLERFYDPESGVVKIDNYNIADLNIQWLRGQMGIVSQEPVLFDRSIAENIAYGDNSRVVPMDEIISAARKANIHTFIAELPEGYDTKVGEKGGQLSGGQKQRVAIARALVRNPKILLLDEATSALDTESEKVVQEALDAAREGRTSIVIAHRLSTIQNANKIVVIRHGEVTEQGTHSELMSKQGFYYKLNVAQHKRGN